MALGIRNSWVAWQFNRAVGLYGRFIENELADKDDQGNSKRDLKDIIENGKKKKQYGSAQALMAIFGGYAQIKD